MVFKKIRIRTQKNLESKIKNYIMVKVGIEKVIITTLTKLGLSKILIVGILILL